MKKMSFILLLTSVMGLASCAGSHNDDGKIKFSFWYTVGQGLQEGIEEKANAFKQLIKTNDGVDVDIELYYQGGYDDIKTKIESGIGSGNLPTLAVAYPDHVATYLSYGQQYVVNLDKYINEDTVGFGKESFLGDLVSTSDDGTCSADDIVPAFYQEGRKYSYNGTYSLPWMKSSEIMFYNLDACKRCFGIGVKNSTDTYNSNIKTEDDVVNYIASLSWDELMSFSAYALEHKSTVLPLMTSPVMYDSDSNLFISKFHQEGIGYSSIGEDGKGIIDFESGENRTKAEALITKYAKYCNDGLLTTKILQNDKYSSSFFTEEKCIFAIGSSGGTGYNSPSAASFKYKIAKVPASNNNPQYISQGPTLTLINNPSDSASVGEKKILYAWKFLKYLTNTDVNTELCIGDSQGYIPVRNSSYTTDYFLNFLDEESIYAEAAKVLLNDVSGKYIADTTFKGSDELRKQVGSILSSVVGGTSVSSAFDSAINGAKKKF